VIFSLTATVVFDPPGRSNRSNDTLIGPLWWVGHCICYSEDGTVYVSCCIWYSNEWTVLYPQPVYAVGTFGTVMRMACIGSPTYYPLMGVLLRLVR